MHRPLIIILCLFFVMTASAHASRLALVIGNANYHQITPLRNPVNDANDMANLLKQLGFQVILKRNANKRTMLKSVQAFGARLRRHGGVGLFYFAGHGLQVNGRNFLVPVDANIQYESDIEFESLEAQQVLAKMELANNGVNIIILDACRDNPYARRFMSLGRSLVGRGLARMESPSETLIAYATAPGQVAADGTGRNGTFTKHLLTTLRTLPHLSITDLFTEVTGKVKNETNGYQVPWQSVSLTQRFCFKACGEPIVAAQSSAPDVSKRLRECEKHFQANRLLTGKGGTAFACYQDVLKTDPNNAQARAGLTKMVTRYAKWQTSALNQGDRKKANRYAKRLLKVQNLLDSVPAVRQRSSKLSSCDVFQDHLKDGRLGPQMVWIPAGQFRMGHGQDQSVARFAMGRYEVTFADYDQFAEATGRAKPDDEGWGRGNRPVIHVSWDDAMAYADWLSEQTGQKYRLPTEAEWAYSVRATTKTARYWGDDPNAACEYANVRGNTLKQEKTKWEEIHHCTDGYVYTAPVGSFSENEFCLFDMLGNVREWTCSEYKEKYSGEEQVCVSKNSAGYRALRGGAWSHKPKQVQATSRFGYQHNFNDNSVGFRLARD